MVGVFSLMGLCYSPKAYAADAVQDVQQARKITGTVVDAQGPVIGASVVVKGTTNGVATDFDGNFSLNANPGQTLVVTYIGYLDKEVKVTASQSHYNITIAEDKQMLDEVVVIAYGQQKKVTITGAVSAVGGDELLKAPVASVANALQGKLPGMSVVQPSGMPGADEPVISNPADIHHVVRYQLMAALDQFKRRLTFTDTAFPGEEYADAVYVHEDSVTRDMGRETPVEIVNGHGRKFTGDHGT